LKGQRQKERDEIFNWLAPADYETAYADSIKKWQPGTGEWFLQHQEFRAWLNEDEGNSHTLFCPGIPGAGKTVIVSAAIKHIQSTEDNAGIAFLYCNYASQDRQTTEDLLAMLLRQVAEQCSSIPDSLKGLHTRHTKAKTRPDIREIYDILCGVAGSYSRLFLIVDALDECSEDTRRTLLPYLRVLQKKAEVRLIATSRRLDSLTQEFEEDHQIEIRADAGDVASFLDSQREKLPECVKANSVLWKTIKDCIVETVDGMCVIRPKISIVPTPNR
jgi:Cdc6-like AAA superfamily ATPase